MRSTVLLERNLIPIHTPVAGSTSVSILQWNTLASSLCGALAFPNSDARILPFSERKPKLIELLKHANADIICLEELVEFDEILHGINDSGAFDGRWMKKTSSDSLDGAALIWNKKRWQLTELHEHSFGVARGQVALIGCFQAVEHQHQNIVVAVTHLKAKRGFDGVRREQGESLINRLQQLHPHRPTFVAGDFNDEPNSPVYNAFLAANFQSAYRHYHGPQMLPEPISTYKKRDEENYRCIDYIWYRGGGGGGAIAVTALLEIPAKSAMPDRLPAVYYPSDHLAIMARFELPNKPGNF